MIVRLFMKIQFGRKFLFVTFPDYPTPTILPQPPLLVYLLLCSPWYLWHLRCHTYYFALYLLLADIPPFLDYGAITVLSPDYHQGSTFGEVEIGFLNQADLSPNFSSSGASVVAIDNKIEQAMDLVKSHLMYAVREEVEVLKEQIKELIEKNSQLEQENNLLKTLASPEQLAQFQAQLQTGSPPATTQPQGTTQPPAQPASQGSGPTA
uniref:TSC22 domain family protein 1 n=1 Tax=Canis lupus familiaris TaxID=9615 RepID=A0A8C0Z012_CANLF